MPRPSRATTPAAANPAHATRAHARFSPSASDRWLACPHSIPFTDALVAANAIPDPELDRGGEAAQRGTQAHEVAEQFLRTGVSMPTAGHWGQHAGNEWLQRQVVSYLAAIERIKTDILSLGFEPSDIQTFIERRVTLSRDVWGSIDCAIVVLNARELWVIDLKTGHRQVDAERNTQLLTYATAIAKEARWAIDRANLVIAQAEGEPPVSTWTCDVATLKAHERACKQAVAKVQSYDPRAPEFNVGDHCLYCPAKAHCPAQRAVALDAFGGSMVVPPDSMPSPSQLTPAFISQILANRKRIEEWMESVAEYVIAQRPEIPGFKVVESVTRTRWRNEDEALAFFRAHAPGALRTVLPTITDARRNVNPAMLDTLTERPAGSPTLVPESDRRPALARPADVFPDAEVSP
jgi:hypothetical protein